MQTKKQKKPYDQQSISSLNKNRIQSYTTHTHKAHSNLRPALMYLYF